MSGNSRRGPSHWLVQLFFILNTLFTISYLIWRVCYTIPFGGRAISLAASILLLVFESLGMVEQFVHFSDMTQARDYPKPDVPESLFPDIDIFISTYNEEEELLFKTINGCLNLKYPDLNKVHIYLCDDGHRASMKAFAAKFPRINYLDRDTHEGKKAGNLNHAVSVTTSPFIVTLDADMIVQSNFLMEIVPYIVDAEIKQRQLPEDDKIPLGFIQTPQSFYDLDLFQFNLFSEASIPNEQDYFYRSIQVAKTRTNSVIYGGSNTFISRKALKAIGGFFTESITEDFATGCNIQKKGFVCMGTGKPLASGLSPNTIESLVKQRVRWARGCIDTGRKLHVIRSTQLSFTQKMNYWASVFYWYAPIKRFAYIISPILFATFGFEVVRCTLPQVLMFWVPMYVCTAISQRLMTSNLRTNKWTAIYETVLFPFLLIPVLLESMGFSLTQFKVTNKSRSGSQRGKNMIYMLPSIILTVLSIIGVFRGLWIILSMNSFGVAVVLFWLIYNLYVMVMSLFFADGREAFRNSERVTVRLPCTLHVGGQQYPCETRDISEGGASVVTALAHFVPLEGAELEIQDRQYHVRMKVRPIRVNAWQDPKAKDGDRWIESQEWNYAFAIREFVSEKGYENYLGILYDRVPTHPEQNLHVSLFNELSKNFMERLSATEYYSRSLPRIRMNTLVQVEESQQPMLMKDFNYKYFCFDPQGPLPRVATLTVGGVRMRCNRVHVSDSMALYEVQNMGRIYANQRVNDRMMAWVMAQSQEKVNKKRAPVKGLLAGEFDETQAVLDMTLEF